jgi:hypothetical protein
MIREPNPISHALTIAHRTFIKPLVLVSANDHLVGGFNHLEKYEFVNGKDDFPYIMENKNHV